MSSGDAEVDEWIGDTSGSDGDSISPEDLDSMLSRLEVGGDPEEQPIRPALEGQRDQGAQEIGDATAAPGGEEAPKAALPVEQATKIEIAPVPRDDEAPKAAPAPQGPEEDLSAAVVLQAPKPVSPSKEPEDRGKRSCAPSRVRCIQSHPPSPAGPAAPAVGGTLWGWAGLGSLAQSLTKDFSELQNASPVHPAPHHPASGSARALPAPRLRAPDAPPCHLPFRRRP